MMFEKNLKYYRLKKNMSMKELAAKCGVTAMAVSNYESGKRRPDISVINRMAEALGIDASDFLSSRNTSLVLDHREFRKNTQLMKTQQEYIIEAVEEYFGRFFDTVEFLCDNPLPTPPVCHSLNRTGNCEEDALLLRKSLGLPEKGPLDDLVGALEDRGVLIFELDVDGSGFSGMNGTVNGYPYIVMNRNMTGERKRTTLMHEIAHVMFIWNDEEKTENEKEATRIACAALITKSDLLRELGMRRTSLTKDLTLVCEEYGISMCLLVKRAAQLGIISSTLEKEFYIKANRAGWKKNEPARLRFPEEPLLLRKLVFRAVNEEGVSITKGAELLGVTVPEMNRFCGVMEV